MKIERRTCKIKTSETEEDYRRIIDDYKYECQIYDLLQNIDLDDKQYERLNRELLLINLTKSFKALYIAYLLTSRIKEDGKNYCLFNIYNNLLINYLLGISKVDPLDKQFLYELPFEPALGISSDPKKMIIQIWVSPDYRKTLLDYLQNIIKNNKLQLVELINLRNDEVQISETSFVLIPKDEDPKKYGDYHDDGTIKGFTKTYKNDDMDIIRISLPESERMKILDDGSEYLEGYDPIEAFYLLLDSCLSEKNDRFVNAKGEPYEYYGLTFWDFCLSVCEPRNSTSYQLGTQLLHCREDVWKMLERCNLTESGRYTLYQDILKHKETISSEVKTIIKKTYPFDYESIICDISNLYYIFPIGAIIEDVYNEAKIAWIKKKREGKKC